MPNYFGLPRPITKKSQIIAIGTASDNFSFICPNY